MGTFHFHSCLPFKRVHSLILGLLLLALVLLLLALGALLLLPLLLLPVPLLLLLLDTTAGVVEVEVCAFNCASEYFTAFSYSALFIYKPHKDC